ncbi:dimethylaniline monooxygenase [N-oxide-forming] 1-like isoform X1 [Falco naumanni]|uniref:dimethylaniline monooxygenase [N-oxide-forming] 1-like isoform X1 n=4 Tax=Falco naumanni TaxID=148594 RepID=UPI001ADE89AA|nr:dimethylaniline monooxygenase [N-oxide-forming] 1-like isoform X1 [Falco naumanni]
MHCAARVGLSVPMWVSKCLFSRTPPNSRDTSQEGLSWLMTHSWLHYFKGLVKLLEERKICQLTGASTAPQSLCWLLSKTVPGEKLERWVPGVPRCQPLPSQQQRLQPPQAHCSQPLLAKLGVSSKPDVLPVPNPGARHWAETAGDPGAGKPEKADVSLWELQMGGSPGYRAPSTGAVKPRSQRGIPAETAGMRVAVVGAGVSGLTATKCCLDEGLEPTCFEQSQDIGGVWRYTEYIEAGRPSLYPSVISNTSKEMSAFSDFPYPEDFSVFLPNAQLLDYLRRYAEHFSLRGHIKFGTTVVSIRKRPDFATTGQWDVVTEAGGKQTSHVFDAIMVCIGNCSEPSLPLHCFPGIEKFQGQYFHSRQYKHPEVFQGKRVLVVGMGNSGADIAVEASRVAAKVTLCTSQGAWVISRVFDHGYPWDMVFNTRLMSLIRNHLPHPLSWGLINHRANQWFKHENYGLQPEKRCLVRDPVLNDDLPSYILTGRITIKPSVKEFKDNSVVFHNCPEEEPIDIVVFCTGYNVSFPFLEETVVKMENKHASLYKYVFPTHLQRPTLAVLGLIKPLGAIMPVSEMQARWVTRVFKGLCQLPPQSVMEKEVNENKKIQLQWFGLSFDEVLKTDWLAYLDQLTSFIGAKPSVLRLLCRDPRLALTIFFGPCTPYQYRLVGPGRWEGARQAILTQWDRTLKPTRTRVSANSSSLCPSLLTVVGFLLLLATLLFGFQ